MGISIEQYRAVIGSFHLCHFKRVSIENDNESNYDEDGFENICNVLKQSNDIETNPGPLPQHFVRGNFHQGSSIFSLESTGRQCVANCLIFLLHSKLKILEQWTSNDLDIVLLNGDELYKKVEKRVDVTYLLPDELPSDIDHYETKFHIEYKNSTIGILRGSCEVASPPIYFETSLERSLKQNFAICVFGSSAVAIAKHNGWFWLFDPHSRDSAGYPCPDGKSILMAFTSISLISKYIYSMNTVNRHFEITPVEIEFADFRNKHVTCCHELKEKDQNIEVRITDRENSTNDVCAQNNLVRNLTEVSILTEPEIMSEPTPKHPRYDQNILGLISDKEQCEKKLKPKQSTVTFQGFQKCEKSRYAKTNQKEGNRHANKHRDLNSKSENEGFSRIHSKNEVRNAKALSIDGSENACLYKTIPLTSTSENTNTSDTQSHNGKMRTVCADQNPHTVSTLEDLADSTHNDGCILLKKYFRIACAKQEYGYLHVACLLWNHVIELEMISNEEFQIIEKCALDLSKKVKWNFNSHSLFTLFAKLNIERIRLRSRYVYKWNISEGFDVFKHLLVKALYFSNTLIANDELTFLVVKKKDKFILGQITFQLSEHGCLFRPKSYTLVVQGDFAIYYPNYHTTSA